MKTDEETLQVLRSTVPSGRLSSTTTQRLLLARVREKWTEIVTHKDRYTVGAKTQKFALMCFAALRGVSLLWNMPGVLQMKFNKEHAKGLLAAHASRSDIDGIAKVRAAMFVAGVQLESVHYVLVAKALARSRMPLAYLMSVIRIVRQKRLCKEATPEGKVPNFSVLYRQAIQACASNEDLHKVIEEALKDEVDREHLRDATFIACRSLREERLARTAMRYSPCEKHTVSYMLYMAVLVACGHFDEAIEYYCENRSEDTLTMFITTCLAHAGVANDPYHTFTKRLFAEARETCSHAVWLKTLKVHQKVLDIEAVENHVVEYIRLHPGDSGVDVLYLQYVSACGAYLDGSDGPFCIDAATSEQLASWKTRPCPPHAHHTL